MNTPLPVEKGENWFKVGLRERLVQGGYISSAAMLVLATLFSLITQNPGEILKPLAAPGTAMFLVTFMYHVKLGKRWNF